jgi:hypothetical protein
VSFMLSDVYVECRKQAHNAECHYAECRGALSVVPLFSTPQTINF